MPSTYTLNNGIELISTGEQSGTWGDTTNTNLGLLDTALDGQVSVTLSSAGSSGSPNTLSIADGAASNGRNRMVTFVDGGDLGATAFVQLTPNDSEKIIYVRNALAGSRSIIMFQGTYNASNDYEVPAGTTAVIYFDGAGSGAVAANVFNNAYFDSLRLGGVSVTAILDEDNMASDSATALSTQQSIKAYVDAQVGAFDSLAEVLAVGNTTGGTDLLVSTGDDITFADNSKAIFGAGSDLQIYHVGDNSYVLSNTGSLVLRSDSFRVLNTANSEQILHGDANGAVTAYYDNAVKLATTSTGIDVTGTVLADGLTVDGGANSELRIDTDAAGYLQVGQFTNGAFIGTSSTNATYGKLRLGAGTKRFVDVDTSGDISFYEDTGTTAKFFWDASAESLGIGTSSPSAQLELSSATDYSGLKVSGTNHKLIAIETTTSARQVLTSYKSGSHEYSLGLGSSDEFSLYDNTSSTERLRIDSSGNVGIGTSSPSATLEVSGTAKAQNFYLGGAGGAAGVAGYSDGSSLITMFSGTHGTPNILTLKTATVERMRIDSSGNVGIGTTSPNNYSANHKSITLNAPTTPLLDLEVNGTRTGSFVADSAKVDLNAVTSVPLRFLTADTERMRIDSSGNVGIGTSSPATALELEGVGNATNITLDNTTASTGRSYSIRSGNTGKLDFYDNDATTARLVIDSSGNVGIGTSSPTGSLSVSDATYLSNSSTLGSSITLNSENTSSWLGTRELISFESVGNGADHRIGTLSVKLKKGNSDTTLTEYMQINGANNTFFFKPAGNERLTISNSTTTFTNNSAEYYTTSLQINNTNADFSGALLDMRATSGSINTTNGRFLRCYSDNGSSEKFHVKGSGEIYTAAGIKFDDAGGSGTATGNTLDSYEKGTFTPDISWTGTNAETYTRQVGSYVRIGNLVHCEIAIIFDKNTSTGNWGIGGLPFQNNATASNDRGCGQFGYFSGMSNGYTIPLYLLENNSTFGYIRLAGTGASSSNGNVIASNGDIGGSVNFHLSITYRTTA